jgi:8-oxo-dGTP pyrophosphatase MutT (NUDIX family)
MSKDKNRNSWKRLAERKIFSSPFMELLERDCASSEDERQQKFYVLNSRDWCNVIPVTEAGKLVLVRQYRVGIEDHTLECPGGVADPGDADVAAAAIREMTEETGYVPLPGARTVSLGWTFPNPAIQNNRAHSFICGPVRRERAQKLDPGEMIDVVEVSVEELAARIATGEMKNAIILNAFLFLMMQAPDLLSRLQRGLDGFARLEHPLEE